MTPTFRRLIPAALLAAAVALGVVPGSVAPGTSAIPPAVVVRAEKCPGLDLDDQAAVVARAEKVDHVFVGRVDDVVRRKRAGKPTLVRHQVTVTTVLVGALRPGQKVNVQFQLSEDDRNRVLGKREMHLFFTTSVGGGIRADYCEGSNELPDGLSASLQRTLEGYLSGAPAPPTRVALHRPEGGADEPARLTRIVAPGAAISLIGVLGLFLVARVGRRR